MLEITPRLQTEIDIIRRAIDPSMWQAIQDYVASHPQAPARLLVISALVVAINNNELQPSRRERWPAFASWPEIARTGLNANSNALRHELEQIACRVNNGTLNSRGTFRGREDESRHPELPVGYSTGAGVTGGE